MKPLIAALAEEYVNRVRFTVVDADVDWETARQHDARSIPTLVVLRDGHQVDRIIGSRPRKAVVEVLDRALMGTV